MHKNWCIKTTAHYLYNTAVSSFLPGPSILALSENFQNWFTKIIYVQLLLYEEKRVLVGIEPTIQTYLRQRAVFKFLCTHKSELALIYICLLCLPVFAEDVGRPDCCLVATRLPITHVLHTSVTTVFILAIDCMHLNVSWRSERARTSR
jgi:hypothetical protein